MAKLNQAKKLLLISNEGEFEKSGSEPLNDDHESISSDVTVLPSLTLGNKALSQSMIPLQ
jgi:hypothetical protein